MQKTLFFELNESCNPDIGLFGSLEAAQMRQKLPQNRQGYAQARPL